MGAVGRCEWLPVLAHMGCVGRVSRRRRDARTVDFELMAQQRKQFDADIRAAYKSPLREAYEAAMTAVAAVTTAMSAPPVKKKAKKE